MGSQKNIAALDIGGNSVMLLHVMVEGDGHIVPVNEFGAITRLAEDVEHTRTLSPEAVHRTLRAVEEIVGIVKKEGVERIIATTTSAIRDAANKTAFLVECQRRLNCFPQVLSGKEEAELIYKGATLDFRETHRLMLVADIGGSNTQIAYGTDEIMIEAQTAAIGCVKLTELFSSKATLFNKANVSRANYIKNELTPILDEFLAWLDRRGCAVICCGGTSNTYAAVQSRLDFYDRKQINNTTGDLDEAMNILRRIDKMNLEERKKVPGMEPDRAEVFPAGLQIIAFIMKHISSNKFFISTNGLRMGLVKHYLDHNIL